jgi:hypothetical protein
VSLCTVYGAKQCPKLVREMAPRELCRYEVSYGIFHEPAPLGSKYLVIFKYLPNKSLNVIEFGLC